MTSKEVLNTLRISRGTLTKYVKIGLIKVENLRLKPKESQRTLVVG